MCVCVGNSNFGFGPRLCRFGDPRAAFSGWREGQTAPQPSCPLLCLPLQPLPLQPPAVEESRVTREERGRGRCLQPW